MKKNTSLALFLMLGASFTAHSNVVKLWEDANPTKASGSLRAVTAVSADPANVVVPEFFLVV